MEGHRRSVKEQAGEFGNPELWRADSLLSLFSRECERPGQLPHGGSVLCISQDLYTHFFVPDCARACEISGVGTPPGKWQNTGGFCAKSPSQCCQKFPRSACIIPAIAVTNGDIQQMELMFGVSVCGAHTCVRVPCASCVQPVSLGKDNQRSLNKPASVLSHHMEAVLPHRTASGLKMGITSAPSLYPLCRERKCALSQMIKEETWDEMPPESSCFSRPGSVSLLLAQVSEDEGSPCSSFRQQGLMSTQLASLLAWPNSLSALVSTDECDNKNTFSYDIK